MLSGSTIFYYDYPGALATEDGISMNQNPDGNESEDFVFHDEISDFDFSPGTRVDGAVFRPFTKVISPNGGETFIGNTWWYHSIEWDSFRSLLTSLTPAVWKQSRSQ